MRAARPLQKKNVGGRCRMSGCKLTGGCTRKRKDLYKRDAVHCNSVLERFESWEKLVLDIGNSGLSELSKKKRGRGGKSGKKGFARRRLGKK